MTDQAYPGISKWEAMASIVLHIHKRVGLLTRDDQYLKITIITLIIKPTMIILISTIITELEQGERIKICMNQQNLPHEENNDRLTSSLFRHK